MRKPDLDRELLIEDWQKSFGAPPPRYLSVVFMRKALAYQAQCKEKGDLPASTRKALLQIAAGKPASAMTSLNMKPGARLVREWNGRTYQVEVVEGGYMMDGKQWPSLSAIAKHITGTSWSGPRFFGLKSRVGGRQ
ncbi:MAG: DUF2924 domain-containing protein [Rhizobiaceae bacterium]|nr:DUF2924 domain-containing protein [Hyphomicrobiales bacterium]NRB29620.1 DUF2924 domain-containing protein [Rhizobiaceae bacterium]